MRHGAFAALVAVAACTRGGGVVDGPPPPARAPYSVERAFLRDDAGRALLLFGANVSSGHKQKPYFDFHGPADFARMRSDWGMNSMRLLVLWAAVEPQKGAYEEAYLAALEQRVTWAEQAGLLVVVDMHQDLYGEGFGGDGAPRWTCDETRYAAFVPTTPWFLGYLDENVRACVDGFFEDDELQAHYAEAWRRVAARLAGHANVVGFDPMNEPHWGNASLLAYEETRLAPLYARVTAAVRGAAPHWVAFLEPGASRNLGSATRLPVPGFPNVVYAPHSYDADAEQGKGFDDARRTHVLENMARLRDEATSLGAALWIGEFGGVAEDPGIGPYMDAALDAMGASGAGGAYWHYGRDDGYGIVDPSGAEKPELAAVLVRPRPERVAGDDVRWSWDEGARELVVDYTARPDVTAPTEIAVPPRRAPVDVTCGDCTVELAPPVVRVWVRQARGHARITLRSR